MQVDKKMFEKTQRILAGYILIKYMMDIKKNFGIDWPSVEWKDLRKPLYSAIGARLHLLYESRMKNGNIPLSVDDQAKFWQTYYRPDGDTEHFKKLTMKFENREYKCLLRAAFHWMN